MHRFEDILYVGIPGRGVTPALLRAAALARASGSRLTVALSTESGGVLESLSGPVPPWRGFPADPRAAELRRLARRVSAKGVRVRTRLLEEGGSLAEVVAESGHDLVVKERQIEGGLGARLFGGPDERLMRESPCPVWLYDPARSEAVRSVLAAVDVSDAGVPELSARVVRIASSLAAREGAKLHAVHAWWLAGESVLRSRSRGAHPDRFRDLLQRRLRERRSRLRGLLAAEGAVGVDALWHLVKSAPAEGIGEVARRVKADVIVLGTLGRSGLPGVVLGNTAEAVLSRVGGSVLAVKPDGPVGSPSSSERAGAAVVA